jgi:hypothetical protein
MKKCPMCKKRNKPTAKKCSGCGASMSDTYSIRIVALQGADNDAELAAELDDLATELAGGMSFVPQIEKLLRRGKVEEATRLYQKATGCSRKKAEKSIKSILAGK